MTAPNIFCFSTELIYEEVIDWEERNKNGLMKEDCSGTNIFIHYLHYWTPKCYNETFFLKYAILGPWKIYRKCTVLTLNIILICSIYLNVISPASLLCLYQMWCQVQPPSPHQPTTFRPCPRSTRWPRTQTAAASTHWRGRWTRVSEHSPWPHVSACLSPPIYNIQKSINHHLPIFSLLHHPPFSNFFVCFSSFLFNLMSIFLFSFLLNLFNIKLLFGTAALRSKLSILSVGSTVYLPLLCGYCLPWYTMYASILIFQVTRSRWGDCCLFHMPVF